MCWECRKEAKRARVEESNKENEDPQANVAQHLISVLQTKRQRKPFEQLQPRQKRARVHDVKAFAAATHTPLSAVQPPRIPAANLVHLPTSTRRSMRTVDGMRIAGEKRIRELKRMLAQDFASDTAMAARAAAVAAFIAGLLRSTEPILSSRAACPFEATRAETSTTWRCSIQTTRQWATIAAWLPHPTPKGPDSLSQRRRTRVTPFHTQHTCLQRMFINMYFALAPPLATIIQI